MEAFEPAFVAPTYGTSFSRRTLFAFSQLLDRAEPTQEIIEMTQPIDKDPNVQDPASFPVRRRGVLTGSAIGVAALGASALGAAALPLGATAAAAPALQSAAPPPEDPRDAQTVDLVVNGQAHRLALDPRTTLLDALREDLGLTGSKKGCDHGQCGACTVHVDGKRVLSCLTLAAAVRGPVTTIEGLAAQVGAKAGELHPMQQAFIDQDALQCGYCTPGQIMSAVACITEGHAKSDAEIREYMSGNLCRCAAYPHIVSAINQAKAAIDAPAASKA